MDGLSVLCAQTPANAELYRQGSALGWLYRGNKQAATNYPLAGRLYLAKSGWLLLSVPNALVRGVFDALEATGAELPTAGVMNVPNVPAELLNAHISVLTAAEVAAIGADNINDRGRVFSYTLGALKELDVKRIAGVSKIWVIQVASPDLSALRKSYGLSALPKDEPFHITIAVRRRGVLLDNGVAKGYETSAEALAGHRFSNPISRGELKAAAAEATYECNCSGRCTCPDTCVCKRSCCGESSSKTAADMPQPRVRIVLPYKGKYLLETLNNPKWPQNLGKRRFIGGGIEAGETPEQTAAREMFEELSVKIKPTAFRALGTDPNKPHEHYLELAKHKLRPGDFKATVGSDPIITLAHGVPEGDDYIGPDIKKLLAPVLQKAAAGLSRTGTKVSSAGTKDLLPGGKADNVPDREFSSEELAIGAADEREHTNNDQIAREIAKDHLQDDPKYYKKEKIAAELAEQKVPSIILKLREAKAHSDNKRYDQKNSILRMLMSEHPGDWYVDDPLPKHMGITHAPTKFRFHADPAIIPTGVKVQAKAAATNPYASQLSATPVKIDRSAGVWKNFIDHLKKVKQRGDWQAQAQQNDHAWRAELVPGYREQMNLALARGQFPKPGVATQIIQRHGDSVLNTLSK
jgi:8-oxo-dGTP pyrophosphatase MutT (NUDIX family)